MSDEDAKHKSALDMEKRIVNLENHVNDIYAILMEDKERRQEDKDRRQKYDQLLDQLLQREEDSAEFWKEAKNKIFINGAWASIGIVCYALYHTFKEQIGN